MEIVIIYIKICILLELDVTKYAELTGVVVNSNLLFPSVNFSKATTALSFKRSFVGSSGNVECP